MLRFLLLPFSYIYGFLLQIRNTFYDLGFFQTNRLPGLVISIGNIAVGGTGKSPMVEAVARFLRDAGHKPAILTRGYKSGLGKDESIVLLGGEVLFTNSNSEFHGDESKMQAVGLNDVPVIAGAKRFAAATKFLKQRPDLTPTHWILDDGFQHRCIERDRDVVLLDAKNPFAGGLLPAGRLRESLASLNRADVVIFSRASSEYPIDESRRAVSECFNGVTHSVSYVSEELSGFHKADKYDRHIHGPSMLLAGVAHPDRILSDLKKINVAVGGSYIISDHSLFKQSEFDKKIANCQSIVTTAKDYWRQPEFFAQLPQPVFVLSLELRAVGAALRSICDFDNI